jgi:ABC-type transporter Mla subunit MlaD
MNTPLDRDALARRVFGAAICHSIIDLQDALANWLSLAEGTAGFLADAAANLTVTQRCEPLWENCAATGEAIQTAVKSAAILAEALAAENRRLAALVDAKGGAA